MISKRGKQKSLREYSARFLAFSNYILTVQKKMVLSLSREQKNFLGLEASRQGCGSGGSGKFLRKRKLEAVNGYRFHLRCSTILALNVFLTQNKQLKHTITRVCAASCCRKYPLLNSQKFYLTRKNSTLNSILSIHVCIAFAFNLFYTHHFRWIFRLL